MSNVPSTPVKVPSSAANYTPATLDPDLRSQINTVLLRDGHVSKIQDALLHSLNSNNNNWPTAIQTHALALLRSGEITTFPALLHRVLEDVRHDSALNPTTTSANGSKPAVNGDAKSNGADKEAKGADKHSLAVPQSVVDEALRVTRESLEAVCEIEDKPSA
ncbi:hypothetical protein B0J13DRAFT_117560 [Dactylonectria estremocensis]|uniref:Uncharacterized protein n=1 Tax=Dactylonectria estremocensis TaxID=1079267 RepID=A0A9P9FEE5_9HYPO|nr:hypothetical protein B0J13DRAFT_117560 [Dactylonectria estremocensis]